MTSELKRYTETTDSQMPAFMEEDPNGEYVLYSEAAAVIERLNNDLGECSYKLRLQIDKTKIAEAELAQIKAQAPVAILKYDRSAGNENEMQKIISCKWLADGEYPLYASPVSDSLKVENGRYRIALEIIGDGFVAPKDAPKYHDEAVNIARAALKGGQQ